jgi:hypothetical protein
MLIIELLEKKHAKIRKPKEPNKFLKLHKHSKPNKAKKANKPKKANHP